MNFPVDNFVGTKIYLQNKLWYVPIIMLIAYVNYNSYNVVYVGSSCRPKNSLKFRPKTLFCRYKPQIIIILSKNAYSIVRNTQLSSRDVKA